MEDCRIHLWWGVLGFVFVFRAETHKLKALLLPFSPCPSFSAFSFQPPNLLLLLGVSAGLTIDLFMVDGCFGICLYVLMCSKIPKIMLCRQQMCIGTDLN